MSGSGSQRTLLVEIMVAVLFFALCATVLLRTFAAAYAYSERAGVESEALLTAQDLAECLYAAQDREALLAGSGFAGEDGRWQREDGAYALEVELTQEEAPAGTLLAAQIRAQRDGKTVVSLPCVRYVPREAGQ